MIFGITVALYEIKVESLNCSRMDSVEGESLWEFKKKVATFDGSFWLFNNRALIGFLCFILVLVIMRTSLLFFN